MKKQKGIKRIILILRDFLILSVIGNGITLLSFPLDRWTIGIFLQNCMFSILIGYPAWKGMEYSVAVLDRKIPWLKFPVKRLITQLLVSLGMAAFLFFTVFSLWIISSEEISFESLDLSIFSELKIAMVFLLLSILVGNSLLFFKNWKAAAVKQEELKRQHLALQYQTLKDQIRPHFLFNSLSSLVTLINTDSEKATQFVHKLSDVYRYVLDQQENEMVSIGNELQFLEDYIFLQKIRFGKNVQVQIDIDSIKNRMVIPLSLQMLVENAIKHNEITKENPLKIVLRVNSNLNIEVKNTLNKRDVSESSHGLGLENLKKRVAFFTDQNVHIEQSEIEFIVTMPTISSE